MTDFDRYNFWRDPAQSGVFAPVVEHCKPEWYLDLDNITRMMLDTIQRYAGKGWYILELGCGTGRNLVGLRKAGYNYLHGIEISQKAIDTGRAYFPEYNAIPVTCAPVEEAIKSFESVDAIFTQGVLMHLPPESAWVFGEIARIAKRLIVTSEGEINSAIHAWARNYQDVFGALGWKQVEWHTCEGYPPLPETTIKRVFIR